MQPDTEWALRYYGKKERTSWRLIVKVLAVQIELGRAQRGSLINNPCLLVFMACVTPSPQVWAGPGGSFLTDRIWQTYGMSLLKLGYKENVASILGAFLSCLFPPMGASCHAERPSGRPQPWQGAEGGSRHQPTRNYGPQPVTGSCQQPCEWAWPWILPQLGLQVTPGWDLACSLWETWKQSLS